jgi:hypothetical protein
MYAAVSPSSPLLSSPLSLTLSPLSPHHPSLYTHTHTHTQPNVDPKAKARQEKILLELKESLNQNVRKEKERKLSIRYHHVRFFERVKLERNIKKLKKKITNNSSGDANSPTSEQAALLESLEHDLHYVLHFPKGEKYVSLLKQCDDGEDQERLEAERDRLRKLVQKQLAEEALVAEADEGKSLQEKHKKLDNSKKEGGEEEDDDDDDDFFLKSDSSDDEDEDGNINYDIISSSSDEDEDGDGDGDASGMNEEKEEKDVHMAKVAKPSFNPRQTNGFRNKYRDSAGARHPPPPPPPSDGGRKNNRNMDNSGRKAGIHTKPTARPSEVGQAVKKQNRSLSGGGDKKRLGKIRGSVEKVPVRKRAEGGRKRRKGK